jgi:predicted transposase YdaD
MEKMFTLSELKQTRFYQEAFQEGVEQGIEQGKVQGKLKAVSCRAFKFDNLAPKTVSCFRLPCKTR